MLKIIFTLTSLLLAILFLSSCASINYAPGRAYMSNDKSKSGVYWDADPGISVSDQ